jgi:hypothetical protein
MNLIQQRQDFDFLVVPREVAGVVGQQPLNSVPKHGRDDVRIMDLFTPDYTRLNQIEQASCDCRVFVSNQERAFELTNGLSEGQTRRPWRDGPWSCRYGEELPQYLTADP